MSGIAAVFDRSGAPVEAGALEAVMCRMSERGPEGSDVRFEGNAALGHWHLASTPEEVGERQPLRVEGLPFTIVLDGRLDNRSDLLAALGLATPEGRASSDATLMLRAYDRWRERSVERFIGEFAFAIFDSRRGELFCARDAMGERTMFYRLDGTRVLVASEPWAIARGNGSSSDLDEAGIVKYFAMEPSDEGRTMFRDVRELLPAESIQVGHSGVTHSIYWQPALDSPAVDRSDEDFAEEFLALLEESVRCRLRATGKVGVQMSGGLDSGSVASLAARMQGSEPLPTFSWQFDELPSCDERSYIDALAERWKLRSIRLTCDDAWPFRNLGDLQHRPNQPEPNPFRPLKDRIFSRARQEGIGVLLTGCYGDELWCSASDWLVELVDRRRIPDATRALANSIRLYGLGAAIRAESMRRLGRRLPGVSAALSCLEAPPAARNVKPWLTQFASSVLTESPSSYDATERVSRVLARMRQGESSGALHGMDVELRHPFRDRRLVEFALSLPAHQLYNRHGYKHVLRTSMRGIVPESVRTRWRPTALSALYYRGLERERLALIRSLEASRSSWSRFVDADWIDRHVTVPGRPAGEGAAALVPWLCASFGSWSESSARSNPIYGARNAA